MTGFKTELPTSDPQRNTRGQIPRRCQVCQNLLRRPRKFKLCRNCEEAQKGKA